MPESELPAKKGADIFEVRFRLGANGGSHEVDHESDVSAGRLPRITQVLALAIHFDDMIRTGKAADYSDVARLACFCRERISQIMRLNQLAPDLQVEVLYLPPRPTGKHPISETMLRRVANCLSWTDQRLEWRRIKGTLNCGI